MKAPPHRSGNRPRGSTAVSASRVEPPDSLDDFPTPPWATRALFEVSFKAMDIAIPKSAWEPTCNRGLMAEPLREYIGDLRASDVFDYGYEHGCVYDFLSEAGEGSLFPPEWIIFNPPFNKSLDFTLKALTIATTGVAVFCRSNWLQDVDRYERLFKIDPPTAYCPFVERVPLYKGGWRPKGKTATHYSWFVWTRPRRETWTPPPVLWIPPGQRRALTRPDDIRRFAHKEPTPLLDQETLSDVASEIGEALTHQVDIEDLAS